MRNKGKRNRDFGAWQGEPLDRLEIKNLVNTLDELSQAKSILIYAKFERMKVLMV